MATAAIDRKDARLGLRMNKAQKEIIGRAAAASGMSVSQWSLDRLVASAREDLLLASTTNLSAQSFDEFVLLLEEPVSPRFEEFLLEQSAWEE